MAQYQDLAVIVSDKNEMKELEKYVLNRESAIIELLELPDSSFTPSTFHDLRVEIKKMNALFELLDYCFKDFNRDKTFRPFRRIFRQAGKVRAIQVEEELLRKHFPDNLPDTYMKESEVKKLREGGAFFAILHETPPARLDKTFRYLVRLLTTIDKKKVTGFMDKGRKTIKKHLIHSELLPDQIHELRKLLKCFYYIENILEPGIHKEAQAKKNDLTDLLGKWHDWQVLGDHLEKLLVPENAGQKDYRQIEVILSRVSSEKELLMNKIKSGIATSDFIEPKNGSSCYSKPFQTIVQKS